MRFQEILNQAFAENFICLTQKSGSSFTNRDPLLKLMVFNAYVCIMIGTGTKLDIDNASPFQRPLSY